jgi:hypothetical protein
MNDASLLYQRVDGRTRQVLDDLARDEGHVADLRGGNAFEDLDEGTTWRRRRGRPRRSR